MPPSISRVKEQAQGYALRLGLTRSPGTCCDALIGLARWLGGDSPVKVLPPMASRIVRGAVQINHILAVNFNEGWIPVTRSEFVTGKQRQPSYEQVNALHSKSFKVFLAEEW
jgi:hypothetical protein